LHGRCLDVTALIERVENVAIAEKRGERHRRRIERR